MEYILKFKNKKYSLNKFTLEMQELVDSITATETIPSRELIEKLWEFVIIAGIPEEDFKELLDGTTIQDIDIRELEVLCVEIIKVYDERRNKSQSTRVAQEFNQMIKENPKIEELTKNLAQITKNLKG